MEFPFKIRFSLGQTPVRLRLKAAELRSGCGTWDGLVTLHTELMVDFYSHSIILQLTPCTYFVMSTEEAFQPFITVENNIIANQGTTLTKRNTKHQQ
jgi:hypothetical protein